MEGMVFATTAMVLGAAAYDVWSFLQAKKAADDSVAAERFDPVITLTTVLPSLALAVGAGLAMNVAMPTSAAGFLVEGFTLLSSGFGLASAQGKLGINNFFRAPSPP